MNKRVLLINTPLENVLPAGIEDDFVDMIGFYPPLGLMYLGTILQENGYEVKILDCVPMKIGYEQLEEEIKNFQPFAVGITTFTMTMVDVLLTAELVKKVNPDIYVILGGHHVLLYPKQSASYPNVDFILQGEADFTFLMLLNILQKGIDYEEIAKIDGVGFKTDGKVFLNYKRPVIRDLDVLPIPDRSLLPMDLYRSIVGRNRIVATVMSSRGCPFKCTFCYTPSKQYRSRSTENIIKELKYLANLGVKEVFFFDDLFALKPQKVIDVARAIRREGLDIDWSFRGRINTITEEVVKEVVAANIHRIQFGIESGVDRILQRIKKGFTTKQVREVIGWCRKHKITTIGNFMIGLPDERPEDVEQTLRFSREIGLNYAQYSILVPYPFTEIYLEGLRRGIISYDFWLEFAENPLQVAPDFKVQYWTEYMSEEYLFKVIKKSFKRFYFRPVTIINKLRELRTPMEFLYAVKGALEVLMFNPKPKTIKNA